MIKGVPKIAAFIGISPLSCYVLLQQGQIVGQKISIGKRTFWHVTEEDAEEARQIRLNPPIYDPSTTGEEFVALYGYKSPPLPLDYGEVYDDETDELLTEPSTVELADDEATPALLVAIGLCTIEDWCAFLNEKRFDEAHAGELILPYDELHRWAKRMSKSKTKTNRIRTRFRRRVAAVSALD